MGPTPEDREWLRQRPKGFAAMKQKWRELLFAHYTVVPEEVEALLPRGVMLDTFPDQFGQERAWIGVVPFRMEGVRPSWAPGLPGLSNFPELNLRTYVHVNGKYPAVFFFSLDADQATACWMARKFYHLPYHAANMSVKRPTPRSFHYRSERRDAGAFFDCKYTVGERLGPSEPGSLDFFLLERYLLITADKEGKLRFGQVHHKPYVRFEARIDDWNENLSKAAKLPGGEIAHALYSPGVDVDVYALKKYAPVKPKKKGAK